MGNLKDRIKKEIENPSFQIITDNAFQKLKTRVEILEKLLIEIAGEIDNLKPKPKY